MIEIRKKTRIIKKGKISCIMNEGHFASKEEYKKIKKRFFERNMGFLYKVHINEDWTGHIEYTKSTWVEVSYVLSCGMCPLYYYKGREIGLSDKIELGLI